MSTFTQITLTYPDSLIHHYDQLVNLPGFALLESSDSFLGRYDILSAYPYDSLIIHRNSPQIHSVFDMIESSLLSDSEPSHLPFTGGAIGYFSYDLGSELVQIYSTAQSNLEEMPLAHFNFYDWGLIVDHQLKKVTLFSANKRPETQAIITEILKRWQNSSSQEGRPFQLKEKFLSLITKASYAHSFQTIHRSLEEGRCYQVNYTQPFHAFYEGDVWSLYKSIRASNPVPFASFLRSDMADILSFSPERFLMHDKGLLLTSPIKGTEKRAKDPYLDNFLGQRLLHSSKNRAENVMIVDLLRNDLGKIAKTGSVFVKALCEIQSFQKVHHLVSHIEADLEEELTALGAFKACFPGGSITGAPKLEAMRVIAETELYARGVYCGSVAYFSNHGRFDSNIAIRTITARNNSLHLAAGGAIVIDSSWQEEYEECFIKIAAILKAIET